MNLIRSICVVVLACLYACSYAQDVALSFHHLTQSDGLSNDTNSYIYKDSRGFVWISSLDGLNRFDGNNIKVYRPDDNSDNAIEGNIVSSNFFEDDEANLWFTTYGSINCYVRAFDHFVSFQLKDSNGLELTEDYRAFHLDDEYGLWVRIGLGELGSLHRFDINQNTDKIVSAIDGKRNYYLNGSNGEVFILSTLFGNIGGLEIQEIKSDGTIKTENYFNGTSGLPKLSLFNIYTTALNSIYLGSPNGMVRFSAISNEYKIVDKYNGNSLGRVWSIARLDDTRLLISSQHQGLLIYDEIQESIVQNFRADQSRTLSLSSDNIFDVFVDRSSCIWISIWGRGLDYACLEKNRFPQLNLMSSSEQKTNIAGIVEGPNDEIWIADRLFGLSKFDANLTLKEKTDPLRMLGFGPDYTLDYIYKDSNERVWGLARSLDLNLCQLIYKDANSTKWYKSAASTKILNSIFEVGDERLLITTRSGVLELSDENILTPVPELSDYQHLPFHRVFQDNNQRLYFSANFDRLIVCELQRTGRISVLKDLNKTGKLNAVYESGKDSILWGASGLGLLKINKYSLEYDLLNEVEDGIPVESMFAISSSSAGELWIKNQSELLNYNISNRRLISYDEVDGIDEVVDGTARRIQDLNGNIWISGSRGITVFHPDSIHSLSYEAQPQITEIKVNAKPITIDTFIGEVHRIDLPYNENTIGLRFVANAYSDPNDTQFRYRMMGYDSTWVSDEREGMARFVNVPWGDYEFQLQATNSDGIWSSNKTLEVCILPPWWATWWAYVLYFIFGYTMLRGYIYYRSRILIKQNAKLEQTVKQRTAELTQSLANLKETQAQLIHSEKMASLGEVTAGVAHEIQNPLNFVNNFSDVSNDLLDEMLEELEKGDFEEVKSIATDVQENLGRITHHGQRADTIIRNMLEHRSASSGEYVLVNINTIVEENLRRTYNLINNKERYFKTVIETNLNESIPKIEIIRHDLGKAIYNILSNALYATFEMKKIADTSYQPIVNVSTYQNEEYVVIAIRDNGLGMSKDIREKVFQPFFTTKPTGEGTGLGMSLTFDVIRSHQGEIKVESEEHVGTTISIHLPKERKIN